MTSGETSKRERCPVCGRPTVEAMKPFCSKRCADVDLQRWLTGSYAIPVADDSERPEDEPGGGDER